MKTCLPFSIQVCACVLWACRNPNWRSWATENHTLRSRSRKREEKSFLMEKRLIWYHTCLCACACACVRAVYVRCICDNERHKRVLLRRNSFRWNTWFGPIKHIFFSLHSHWNLKIVYTLRLHDNFQYCSISILMLSC